MSRESEKLRVVNTKVIELCTFASAPISLLISLPAQPLYQISSSLLYPLGHS